MKQIVRDNEPPAIPLSQYDKGEYVDICIGISFPYRCFIAQNNKKEYYVSHLGVYRDQNIERDQDLGTKSHCLNILLDFLLEKGYQIYVFDTPQKLAKWLSEEI